MATGDMICPSCQGRADSGGAICHQVDCPDNPFIMSVGPLPHSILTPDPLPDALTMGTLRNLVALEYAAFKQLGGMMGHPNIPELVQAVLGRYQGVLWPPGTAEALVLGLEEELL